MTSDDNASSIPKLNDAQGWRLWSTKVLVKIGGKSATALDIMEGAITVNRGSSAEHREAAMKALDVIHSSIGDDAFHLIEGKRDPREAYLALEAQYGASTQSQARLLREFDALRQKEPDPSKYCIEAKALFKSLDDIGTQVDFAIMVNQMRKGLHLSFRPFMQLLNVQLNTIIRESQRRDADIRRQRATSSGAAAMASTAEAEGSQSPGNATAAAASMTSASIESDERLRDQLLKNNKFGSLNEVCKLLLDTYFDNHGTNAHHGSQSTALHVHGPPKNKGNRFCTNCKRTNHTVDQCWSKGGGKEGARPFQRQRQGKKERVQARSKPSAPGAATSLVAAQNQDEPPKGEQGRTAAVVTSAFDHRWIMDSGAAAHITCYKEDFESLTLCNDLAPVTVGGGEQLQVKGEGTVLIIVPNGTKTETLELQDCLYIPDIGCRLFSLDAAAGKGLRSVMTQTGTKVLKGRRLICTGTRDAWARKTYLDTADQGQHALITHKPVTQSLQLWHERLGHTAMEAVKATLSNNGVNIKEPSNDTADICQACLKAGQRREPFGTHKKVTDPLSVVHADLMGPWGLSHGGKRFSLTLVDEASGYIKAVPLHAKSEAAKAIQDFIAWAETQSGFKVKVIQSDRGGEFLSNPLKEYFTAKGIEHHLSIAGISQQNGVAERANRTIQEMVRSMLHGSNSPSSLWAEAALYGTTILNSVVRKGKTAPSSAALFKNAVDLKDLRVWGCTGYLRVQEQGKASTRSKVAKFVGFTPGVKGWRFIDETGRVFESRDVVFDEKKWFAMPSEQADEHAFIESVARQATQLSSTQDLPVTYEAQQHVPVVPGPRPTSEEQQHLPPSAPTDAPFEQLFETDSTLTDLSDLSDHEVDTPPAQVLRRSGRETRLPGHLRGYQVMVTASSPATEDADSPSTVAAARQREDWHLWEQAIQKELDNHKDNQTWRLEVPPKNRKLVGCKWVLTIKRKANGSIDKYKARLVARGFSQVQGIDYQETFSPVVRTSAIRLVIAIAAMKGWPVHQMDVTAAYLNGELKEEVFMCQPPDYPIGARSQALRLQKGLYGLKQSGRLWYQKAHSALTSMGFGEVGMEPGLYKRKGALLCLYVDDIVIAAETDELLISIKSELTAKFKMTDAGRLNFILGIEVEWLTDHLKLSQRAYIKKMLRRFNMTQGRHVKTPLPPSFAAHKADEGEKLDRHALTEYKQIVGSIMYASTTSRMDLAYATGLLCRRFDSATEHWLKAAKHVLRYLSGTIDKGLLVPLGLESASLEIYTDANFAEDLESAKSTSGMVSFFNGAAINWLSRLQKMVVTSTLEAEYVALNEGVKEALWLRRLLQEMGERQHHPTVIWVDNKGAITTSKDSQFHKRTKHINVKYHFVRQHEGINVSVQHVPSASQKADILTKLLPAPKHAACVKQVTLT